jgi:hypothetical protein
VIFAAVLSVLAVALSAHAPVAHAKVDPLFACPAIQLYPEDCKLNEITPANPGGCFAYTGIAFDGTNLYVTCQQNNIVAVVSPLDGHLIRSFRVPAGLSEPFLGASAWDRNRNAIWMCVHDDPVPNALTKTVALIDPNDGHVISQFTTDGCWTGVAYDGTDDTVWTSPDTSPFVSHWTTTGFRIGFQPFNVVTPLPVMQGHPSTGLATGGKDIFIASEYGGQVWEVDKVFEDSVFMVGRGGRNMDMECDDKTFFLAGVPKPAIWLQDHHYPTLTAYEIGPGVCRYGGGFKEDIPAELPVPPADPPAAPPAPVTPAAPAKKLCSGRRLFTIHLVEHRRDKIKKVVYIKQDNKRLKFKKSAGRWTARVDLRKKTKKKVNVSIKVTTRKGKTRSGRRIYNPCTLKIEPPGPPALFRVL